MATGTVTWEYVETHGPVKKMIASWTSTAGGAAGDSSKDISGYLLRVVTDPGATAPTDDWDLALTDEYGIDIGAACDCGAAGLQDRDTANTEVVELFLNDAIAGSARGYPVCGPVTFAVTNAGDSKTGQIIIYWVPAM